MNQVVPSIEARREMARKARSSHSRIIGKAPQLPSDWGPYSINNPKTDIPFTDESAWMLIADLLEDEDCAAEFLELMKPPGVQAIVILWVLVKEKPPLYIKIHMGKDKVIGRSFHFSHVY